MLLDELRAAMIQKAMSGKKSGFIVTPVYGRTSDIQAFRVSLRNERRLAVPQGQSQGRSACL